MSHSVDFRTIRRKIVDCLKDEVRYGLLTYDCYLLWRGDEFETCDVQATVRGFHRPEGHCPAKYRIRPDDADQMARIRVTARIEAICAPIWHKYDNVRVIVRLVDRRPRVSEVRGFWALLWARITGACLRFDLPVQISIDKIGYGVLA